METVRNMRTGYDLIGMKFGKLTVLELTDDHSHKEKHWKCRCDCGREYTAASSALVHGYTHQCSVCAREQGAATNNRGLYEPLRLRRIWNGMISRCYSPNNPQYADYGGRGITVCDEWSRKKGKGYLSFKKWAFDNGYNEDLTIDRIDNDGGYSPENCRWADDFQQANNRRGNHLLEYNGEVDTMANWARRVGLDYFVIAARINRLGWSAEKALSTPYVKGKRKNDPIGR